MTARRYIVYGAVRGEGDKMAVSEGARPKAKVSGMKSSVAVILDG